MSQGLQSRLALPLVELLIPLLKTLDDDAKKSLLEQAAILAKWNGKLSLFEICLYNLLKSSFDTNSKNTSSYTIKDINLVAFEFNLIISSFIHSAGGSSVDKEGLHQRMMNIFSIKPQALINKDKITPKNLYATFKKIERFVTDVKALFNGCMWRYSFP